MSKSTSRRQFSESHIKNLRPTLSTISDFSKNLDLSCSPSVATNKAETLISAPKTPKRRFSIFSIDFEAKDTTPGDRCLVNKHKTMRVGEFWDEITSHSQKKLITALRTAKLSIDKFREQTKNLKIMFKRPQVCCQNDVMDNTLFSGKLQNPKKSNF